MTLTIDNVSSVYSGKRGMCACGCAGKHTYSTTHKAWASKDRGYEVGDDEVNDRTVKNIFNKVMNAPNMEMIDNEFAMFDTETRTYVVYFKK
jgi:hypothetical protein